mmetsp:Transcript_107642/g.270015  ORF Transcript_107642/g.270015 Transcript_107642/m.270015 type:complete len:231 (-) Transcript_107642:486-1178(-)
MSSTRGMPNSFSISLAFTTQSRFVKRHWPSMTMPARAKTATVGLIPSSRPLSWVRNTSTISLRDLNMMLGYLISLTSSPGARCLATTCASGETRYNIMRLVVPPQSADMMNFVGYAFLSATRPLFDPMRLRDTARPMERPLTCLEKPVSLPRTAFIGLGASEPTIRWDIGVIWSCLHCDCDIGVVWSCGVLGLVLCIISWLCCWEEASCSGLGGLVEGEGKAPEKVQLMT